MIVTYARTAHLADTGSWFLTSQFCSRFGLRGLSRSPATKVDDLEMAIDSAKSAARKARQDTGKMEVSHRARPQQQSDFRHELTMVPC